MMMIFRLFSSLYFHIYLYRLSLNGVSILLFIIFQWVMRKITFEIILSYCVAFDQYTLLKYMFWVTSILWLTSMYAETPSSLIRLCVVASGGRHQKRQVSNISYSMHSGIRSCRISISIFLNSDDVSLSTSSTLTNFIRNVALSVTSASDIVATFLNDVYFDVEYQLKDSYLYRGR